MPNRFIWAVVFSSIAIHALSSTPGHAQNQVANSAPFIDSLQHALDNSDILHAQVETIQAAREGLITARAGQEWTTRLTASDTRARIDTNRQQDIIDDSNSVSVIITKSLYDGGLGRANFNVAELQLASAQAAYVAGEQAVLLAASEAYVDVAAGQLSLAVADANVLRLKQHEAASRLRVEVGESTPTQLALAQSRLARAEASQISAENTLINARARYETIFARPPAHEIALPDLAIRPPFAVAEAGRKALENHPDHRIAVINEQLALKGLDALTAQVRPTIDLNLMATSTDTYAAEQQSERMSAQVTFSTPILPRRSVRAAGRQAAANHRGSASRLADVRDATRLAAEVAYRNHQTATSLITASRAERDATQLFRDGVDREVNFGVSSLLDLLDAEQDAMLGELTLINARRDFVLAGLRLLAAMGQLTAEEFGLRPLFNALDELERYDVPVGGYPPRVRYP